MGCHNWYYTKVVNPPSEETMYKYFTKITYQDSPDEFKGDFSLKYKYMIAWSDENSKISYEKVPYELRELISDNPVNGLDFDIFFDNQGMYKATYQFSDEPRVYGYPDVTLYNYEDAVNFINSSKVVEEYPEGFKLNEDKLDTNGELIEYFKLDKTKEETLRIFKDYFNKEPNLIIRFG